MVKAGYTFSKYEYKQQESECAVYDTNRLPQIGLYSKIGVSDYLREVAKILAETSKKIWRNLFLIKAF